MRGVRVLLALCLVLLAQAAFSDTLSAYGELRCEGETAIIRFASAFNDDPPVFPDVPEEFGLNLPETRIDGNSCELADGQKIKVLLGARSRRLYGECGGALDAFASLWIGERKVLSRMWVVRSCFSEAFLPGNGRKSLHRAGSMSPTARRAEARGEGWPTSEISALPMISARRGLFETLDPNASSPEQENGFSMLRLDFDNDGREDLVIRQTGKSGAFYGQKFYVARDLAAERLLGEVARVRAEKSEASWEDFYRNLEGEGVFQWIDAQNSPVPASSDNHTPQGVLETKLGTFVFAAPLSGRVLPTGLIYRPLAGGAPELVCVFQRVEENF